MILQITYTESAKRKWGEEERIVEAYTQPISRSNGEKLGQRRRETDEEERSGEEALDICGLERMAAPMVD